MISISSSKNDKIRDLIRFRNKNGRNTQNQILIEGSREIERALAAGIVPREIYFCPELLPEGSKNNLFLKIMNTFPQADFYQLTAPVFETIAYKNNPFGLLVMAEYQPRCFSEIVLPANPACLICDNIEKPGNLGALLRTADGVGMHAIYQTGSLTDFRNPNVIRASTGALFSLNYAQPAAEELIRYLKIRGIKIIAADPEGELIYSDVDYLSGYALVVGAEDRGLSEIYRQNADHLVRIPMLGAADSLNVHQAATVILFEALRQRGFKN